jgi:hypothetical protein
LRVRRDVRIGLAILIFVLLIAMLGIVWVNEAPDG